VRGYRLESINILLKEHVKKSRIPNFLKVGGSSKILLKIKNFTALTLTLKILKISSFNCTIYM